MNILDPEVVFTLFRNNYPLFAFAVFSGTFLFTYYLVPKVLWVTKEKKLMKPIIGRSAHTREVPAFGGVAFFMTLILIISMLQSVRIGQTGNHLIAAITILFMVGLKDDLVISTPRVKLFGQLTAAVFIIFSPDLQIHSLHGFLGIYEIPTIVGYALSAFLVVGLVNAYNLIDGINGLAGIIGIIVAAIYAWVFYLADSFYYVLIAISVIGVLTAFLRFNFSRGKNKIFMGDSGSLVIGLIIAFLTLKIIALPPNMTPTGDGLLIGNRVLFILSVLFVPVFDTARVMITRLLHGKSPFEADRNHAHHILLDLGFNHPQASLLLGGITLGMVFLFALLKSTTTQLTLGLGIAGGYILFFILFEWASKKAVKKRFGKTFLPDPK